MIHEGIGIKHGVITTLHDVTNTQVVVDAPHKDLRRARTRKVQRSSRVTSSLLHLHDGPMADARNRKVGRVPEDFGWIHEYDVQQELQKIGCTPATSPATTK